uniref:Secreted protein n=1 Tax=Mesocestoides corti TaxID=53468 RepID=A0A5K3G5M8_MESCO
MSLASLVVNASTLSSRNLLSCSRSRSLSPSHLAVVIAPGCNRHKQQLQGPTSGFDELQDQHHQLLRGFTMPFPRTNASLVWPLPL